MSSTVGRRFSRGPAFALAFLATHLGANTLTASAQIMSPEQRPYDQGAAASIENALNMWERRLIQDGLILLGFYNGFSDGEFRQATRNAIADYQRSNNRASTGQLAAVDILDLGGTALAIRKKLQWQPLRNSRANLSLSYPAAVLTRRQENRMGGETLESGDGQISLKTLRFSNVVPGQIDSLFQSLATQRDTQVTYRFKRPNLFILSGTSGNNRFYSRSEQRGNEIRGYDLTWNPGKDSKLVDNISVLVSSGFYPFGNDPADGEASYPTILQLARQAEARSAAAGGGAPQGAPQSDARQDAQDRAPQDRPPQDRPSQAGPPQDRPPQGSASAEGSGQRAEASKEGVSERAPDAMPPPQDGALVTSDGKGLRFTYHYFPPQDQKLDYAYRWAVETKLFSRIPEITALDGLFVTPRPLQFATRQCGAVNAFYSKKVGAIFLCYELIDSLRQMGEGLAKGASDPKALTIEFVRNNLRFILLHESGHALIDLLDLPAVGREEDSVDQVAAVMLMTNANKEESKNDLMRVLQLASAWFKVNSQTNTNLSAAVFADEHSLDAQRYFNLLCMIYGFDPNGNRAIVERGMLPKERADRCPSEAAKIRRSWARLLVPNFAPRFKPKDEASAGPTQGTPGSPPPPRERNPLEWDGKSNPFDN